MDPTHQRGSLLGGRPRRGCGSGWGEPADPDRVGRPSGRFLRVADLPDLPVIGVEGDRPQLAQMGKPALAT
jgi:hypothetical protein